MTDAQTNQTTYEYDGFDRLSKTRYPSTTAGSGTSSTTDYEQLSYDAGSNVTGRRLRDATSIGYSYDALNRLVTKDLPGSELDVTYGYDLLSRPLSAATSAQTLSFTYDALSRTLTQSGPLGTVTSAYDLAGRRTRLTWPDAFYVSYDYDVTGEMTAVRENGATSGIGVLASYGYDDLGRRVSLTRGNGAVSTYTPDAVSRLSSLAHAFPAASTSNVTSTFSYTPASQIAGTTRSNDSYAWTGAANRNDASTLNGLNQTMTVGAASLGYDARGNLTANGSATYSYTSENLLTGTNLGVSLTYDPLDRLSRYTTASGATDTLYDGSGAVADLTAGSLSFRYVWGANPDELLVTYLGSGTGTRRFWSADERGSIIAASNAGGTVTSTYNYDEYGNPGANPARFGYTGQRWLAELGLSYYKARMYAPSLGRFLQTDPIGYADGMNWYGYVGGDPVNRTDPSGLEYIEDVGWIVTGTRPFRTHGGGFIGGGGGKYFFAMDSENHLSEGTGSGVPQNELPICQAPAFGAHIQVGFDMAIFLGSGGGLSGGIDIDPDTGMVTAFASSRSGSGLGLIAGLGISFTDSGPAAGHSYDNKNAQLGLGVIGGGISKSGNQPATGSIGLSLGPKAGFELSKTNNFTRTQELGGKSTPLCKFAK